MANVSGDKQYQSVSEIRAVVEAKDIKVNKKWDDASLDQLRAQCKGDAILIESSLGFAPKEILVKVKKPTK